MEDPGCNTTGLCKVKYDLKGNESIFDWIFCHKIRRAFGTFQMFCGK